MVSDSFAVEKWLHRRVNCRTVTVVYSNGTVNNDFLATLSDHFRLYSTDVRGSDGNDDSPPSFRPLFATDWDCTKKDWKEISIRIINIDE
jgi:hypothetical protein